MFIIMNIESEISNKKYNFCKIKDIFTEIRPLFSDFYFYNIIILQY